MELSENSEFRAATAGQVKSTGYFMELQDWPEFDLIRPAGANRLIVGSKTVRTIDKYRDAASLSTTQGGFLYSTRKHDLRIGEIQPVLCPGPNLGSAGQAGRTSCPAGSVAGAFGGIARGTAILKAPSPLGRN